MTKLASRQPATTDDLADDSIIQLDNKHSNRVWKLSWATIKAKLGSLLVSDATNWFAKT